MKLKILRIVTCLASFALMYGFAKGFDLVFTTIWAMSNSSSGLLWTVFHGATVGPLAVISAIYSISWLMNRHFWCRLEMEEMLSELSE